MWGKTMGEREVRQRCRWLVRERDEKGGRGKTQPERSPEPAMCIYIYTDRYRCKSHIYRRYRRDSVGKRRRCYTTATATARQRPAHRRAERVDVLRRSSVRFFVCFPFFALPFFFCVFFSSSFLRLSAFPCCLPPPSFSLSSSSFLRPRHLLSGRGTCKRRRFPSLANPPANAVC